MGSMSKRAPTGDRPGELRLTDDSLWSDRWPRLLAFLTELEWADGSPREPGTVTLFLEGRHVKVCLSDRAQDEVAFVSGESPADALDAAESGLRDGDLDWRASKSRRR